MARASLLTVSVLSLSLLMGWNMISIWCRALILKLENPKGKQLGKPAKRCPDHTAPTSFPWAQGQGAVLPFFQQMVLQYSHWRTGRCSYLPASGKPHQEVVTPSIRALGAILPSRNPDLTSPTYLTLSLPAACKGRATGRCPSSLRLQPSFLFPFFPEAAGQKGEDCRRAGQEEETILQGGKKENAEDLTPNLSLFKNEIFPPKVKK